MRIISIRRLPLPRSTLRRAETNGDYKHEHTSRSVSPSHKAAGVPLRRGAPTGSIAALTDSLTVRILVNPSLFEYSKSSRNSHPPRLSLRIESHGQLRCVFVTVSTCTVTPAQIDRRFDGPGRQGGLGQPDPTGTEPVVRPERVRDHRIIR